MQAETLIGVLNWCEADRDRRSARVEIEPQREWVTLRIRVGNHVWSEGAVLHREGCCDLLGPMRRLWQAHARHVLAPVLEWDAALGRPQPCDFETTTTIARRLYAAGVRFDLVKWDAAENAICVYGPDGAFVRLGGNA